MPAHTAALARTHRLPSPALPDDTIITWTDVDVGTDVALSFQEASGCHAIWCAAPAATRSRRALCGSTGRPRSCCQAPHGVAQWCQHTRARAFTPSESQLAARRVKPAAQLVVAFFGLHTSCSHSASAASLPPDTSRQHIARLQNEDGRPGRRRMVDDFESGAAPMDGDYESLQQRAGWAKARLDAAAH